MGAEERHPQVVTLVSDYGPGNDAEKCFGDAFAAGGGTVIEKIRAPLKSPRLRAVPAAREGRRPRRRIRVRPLGQGSAFMKQFTERGLDKSGVKLIGTATSPTTTCSPTSASPRSAR